MQSLNSETLHLGDEVLAKVRVEWTDGECTLQAALVVHGRVAKVNDGGRRKNGTAIAFHYLCHEQPRLLLWLALLAPEPVDGGNLVLKQSVHSPSFGEGGGLGRAGNTKGDFEHGVVDLSGHQNPSFPVFTETDVDRKAKRPEAVKTGQVWRLPRLQLAVGAGPEDSTVISSREKQVRLPMGSILVLLPESAAVMSGAASNAPARKVAASKPAVLKLPPEIGACTTPACTVVSSALVSSAGPAPQQTIALDRLGYQRLKSAEMHDLEFGAASAFLGEDHLLFTFHPHTLVKREKGDRPEDQPHVVRAILFDIKSGRVERTAEWRVRRDEQYLWVVDGEHIVVNDGGRLRWFGRGLHETQSLKLDGPLAWLRMSPDRKHYAVGVVQELHTREEHADLAKADAAGPEEQVRVELLDGQLKIEDEAVASSRAMPPVLLDGGRAELRRARGDVYYLREFAWNRSGEPRDFARMQSSCVPKVKSLSGDLVMAEGCDKGSNDHWLRVFREDGSPVLKSVVHWREFSPLTAEDGEGGLFAMTTAEGGGEYVPGSVFHGTDLFRETVRVHRAIDGREIFATHMRFPLPANQPVAFAPGGGQVAVIDGDEILIYGTGVPSATTAAAVAQR